MSKNQKPKVYSEKKHSEPPPKVVEPLKVKPELKTTLTYALKAEGKPIEYYKPKEMKKPK